MTFGFARGGQLADSKKLLQGTGKNMRHVKLRTIDDLQRDGLRELIAEAAALNERDPQRSMGSRRK